MQGAIAKLDEILVNKISEFQENGIIYLMIIIAVVIAIFIIYDKENNEPTVLSSLSRCIRRFIVLVADVASDIISIFSSLTEILNLIRILVFGKVDSQTQIFLANYAIIFMSVVSYFTTMNGLKLVLDIWQAILASFGIQVGILVFSSRLSHLIADKLPDNKNISYIYRIKETNKEFSCNCENGQKECSKVALKRNNSLSEQDYKNNIHSSSIGKLIREWKSALAILLILLSLMMCSSFFSYNAFWEKFVLPGIPLNEFVTAKISISEVEEEYSKSLKEYQQQLESILYQVNNKILEKVDVISINLLETQIQDIDREIKSSANEIKEKENRLNNYEYGSVEYNQITDEIGKLEKSQEELEESKKRLDAQLNSDYASKVNESINYLSAFYASPLNEDVSIDKVESCWRELQSSISQMDEAKDLFTTKEKTDLDIILNNYLQLCRYYREKKYVGFKIEYSSSSDSPSTNIEYETETRAMLLNAIESLEKAPSFVTVNSIWDEGMIEETSRTKLLEKLYVIYRDSSGQVEETEKAIRSLTSLLPFSKTNSAIIQRSKGIILFVLVLAVFIDCTIVLISIWKGNKSTNRSFSELRRLVGILFIRAEKERDEETRRMQLSVAFGLLFGVLMFVLQQLIPSINTELDDKVYWLFFMYCACGLLAAVIIGKAIGRSQNITENRNPDNKAKELAANLLENNEENIIKQYLQPAFIEILEKVERKTICVIDAKTCMLKEEKNVTCIKVDDVKDKKLYVEFSMLESYKIISISEDDNYYIIKDIFWKMLYTNILNKMSGNIMLPMSVEDLINYEDSDENNN